MEAYLKKIILALLFVTVTLFAELRNEYLSQELIDSKIPIVDIRTKTEWRETGILPNAIPITFYNEQGAYNLDAFLAELNKKVDTKKPFALMCRIGTRTRIVSNYLAHKLNYNVTNIQGGLFVHGMKKPPTLVRYMQ